MRRLQLRYTKRCRKTFWTLFGRPSRYSKVTLLVYSQQVGAKVLDDGLVVLLVVLLYFGILVGFQRVLSHSEDQALLKAYINEWGKFFDQCGYLPKPFSQVEITLNNQSANNAVNNKKHKNDDSDVRKVSAFWGYRWVWEDDKRRASCVKCIVVSTAHAG
jgi:hypothetical protein